MAAPVEIRPALRLDEMQAISDLFDHIWGRSFPLAEPSLMKAVVEVGGYLIGAWEGPDLIGGTFAFCGVRDGQVRLHSHVAGVRPDRQVRGIGLAMKRHQREWAIERGIDIIEWTFDPLIRRNAWFNLQRLGITVTRYDPNCYGTMSDAINGDDETDRLLAWWQVSGPRATAAAADRLGVPEIEVADLIEVDEAGGPSVIERPISAPARCLVPDDIMAIRRSDPGLARAWRLAVRDALHPRLEGRATITGMTNGGHYVVEPG